MKKAAKFLFYSFHTFHYKETLKKMCPMTQRVKKYVLLLLFTMLFLNIYLKYICIMFKCMKIMLFSLHNLRYVKS